MKYTLDDLKATLGISNKYPVIKDFRRRVLDVIDREINEYSPTIQMTYEYMKTKRKVTGIRFKIVDKPHRKAIEEITETISNNYEPSEVELDSLSWSQFKAYEALVKFGVYIGIAFKQMLPGVKGGNVEGFEDYFVRHAIGHFKKWSKQQKDKKTSAATFVQWWHTKQIFDAENDVFWKIIEIVNIERKKLDQEVLDNRLIAKDMTKKAFMDWYKQNKSNTLF